MFPNHIYIWFVNISQHMDKPDLELDNLQWFICHKTKPNQN